MQRIALIIGAQKSGTTSLFRYLAQHPQICASKKKESLFFSSDIRASRGLDYYFSLWDWQEQHHVAIEASPAYTMLPAYSQVTQRIAQVKDVEFLFLYIMRNPLQRIESHVVHQLSTGVLKVPEVTEDTIAFSKYAYQLDPFVQTFGRERLHLLLLEDLQRSPEDELRKVYRFLGIDAEIKLPELTQVHNGREANYFHLPLRLRQLYTSSLGMATVGRIPKSLRRSFYNILPRKKPHEFNLSDPEKGRILQALQPDLVRLQNEYGVEGIEEKWQLPLAEPLVGSLD